MLLRALELEQFMQNQDPFRIDKSGLLLLLQGLLGSDNIKILQYNNDISLNARIARIILSSVRLLDYKHLIQLTPILEQIAPEMTAEINKYASQSKRAAQWSKMAPWVVVVITLIICGIIYFLGKP